VLVIAIKIAGLVFGERAARGQIADQIKHVVGSQVAQAVEDILRTSQESASGTWAAIISFALLLVSATAVFVELQDGLNTIWKVQAQANRGWLGVVKDRLWSFTAMLGIGFLLLVSLVLSAALTAVSSFFMPDALPGGTPLWELGNAVVSFAFVTLLFAMIYKVLPDVEIAWSDVWVGAGVTALLFTAGKHLIGLYLGRFGVTSAYGAAGSVVVILLWVYYSSQILLFGAEFTQVYAKRKRLVLPVGQASVPVRHTGTEAGATKP